MKSIKLALNLAFLALSSAAFAQEVTLAIELNPMGSFEAKSTALSGKAVKNGDKFTAEKIVLDLTTLDSTIELRDKHMKEEYFETKKFPKAVLIKAVGKGGKFAGILMIRNVKNKIGGTYKVNGKFIEAEFTTPMSAYKIKKASYMGVGVEDAVKVKVSLPIGG